MARDKYQVGELVSTDYFEVGLPGQLLERYICECKKYLYHGGTVFNDAASGIIWVENQVPLGAGETVLGKKKFEEWLYKQATAEAPLPQR